MIKKDWILESIESAARAIPEQNFVTTELGQNALTFKDIYELVQKIHDLFSIHEITDDELGLACVKRGSFQAALIVSLLAQYQPTLFIEPNSKKDEIIRMVKNLNCRFLILEKSIFESLQPQLSEYKAIEFENLDSKILQKSIILIRPKNVDKIMNSNSKNNFKDLRWFLHTSGTTGRSKPVAITTESLRARTDSEVKIFQIQENSLLLNVLSFCHDLGLNQLLTALLTRSTVEIYSLHFAFDFLKRLQFVNYHGVTGIPNIWKKIIKLAIEKNIIIPGKFYITISGGSLKKDEVRDLHAVFSEAQIIKTYGQTETFRSLYEISNPEQVTSFLAKPYHNVQVGLLKDGTLVPTEDEGELVHFGDGLFAGYWIQSEDDQSRFIPGELISESLKGMVGFKTGDFFRKQNDQYEFLGRYDDLVKVNGRRFYLSEIENSIQDLSFVSDVVVCKQELDSKIHSDESLIAFVILNQNKVNVEDEIKIHCVKKLESFKVPNHILIVEKFPLTTTGKTDRIALIGLLQQEAGNDKN